MASFVSLFLLLLGARVFDSIRKLFSRDYSCYIARGGGGECRITDLKEMRILRNYGAGRMNRSFGQYPRMMKLER